MIKNEVDQIIKLLNDNNYQELSNMLINAKTSGSTGGEVVSDIAIVLLQMKNDHPNAYELISNEFNLFFEKYKEFLE